jgi:hypothetical protein
MTEAQSGEEPEVVYHYTTMDTMLKIVESASIWATSIKYLNDTSEGDHFLDLILRRLPDYIRERPRGPEDVGILQDVLNMPQPSEFESFRHRPFVASFSRDDDSLPQWRSYCANGNGVAIGFLIGCLRRGNVEIGHGFNPRVLCNEIEYVDSFNVKSIDDIISVAVRAAAFAARTHILEDGMSRGQVFRRYAESAAYIKKHPSFSNEREFRLLVHTFGVSRYSQFQFRATRSTLVPYVQVSIPRELPIDVESEETKTQPKRRPDFIARVVIGPSPSMMLSVDALRGFFEQKQMQVEVVPSKIPYRDW